jgi:HK97 family phage major capsid protein
MKGLKELKEERSELMQQQDTIMQQAKNENRELTEAEEIRFDDIQSQIEGLKPKIKRAKIVEENQKRAAEENGERVEAPAIHKKENSTGLYSLTRALRSAISGKSLEGLEKEADEEYRKEIRSAVGGALEDEVGITIGVPSTMMEMRDQSVTGDSGTKGGKLVITEAPRMVAPLLPNNPLQELGVTPLTGLKGNVPLLSNTDVEFVWADENENITTKTDADFDGPILKPKRIVAVVDISKQLIMQSTIGVESFIIRLLNNAYGRALARAVLNGPGGKSPLGILNLVGVNDLAGATATAIDYEKVVALETAIEAENATDESIAYVCNKTLKGSMKTKPKVAGTDSIMLSDGKTLNGSKLLSTNLIPELGGNHPLIYGDWSQVFTGTWGGISMTVDPYTQSTAGKIRLVINSYADVQVVHPKAFAYNKKLVA